MSVVSYVDSINGPFLIPTNDTSLRLCVEYQDLLNNTQSEFHKILQVLKTKNKSKNVVIDCGTNMGTFSIPLAKAHSDLNFIGFEIQKLIYYSFCGTIALQGLLNITPNLKGVGDKFHHLQIKVPNYNLPANYGSFEARKPFKNSDIDAPGHYITYTDKYTTVEVITIDSLNEAPLLIKLDIEGMEYQALVGAEQTIDIHEPVIYIERHKSDETKILEFFQSKPYTMKLAVDDHFFFIPNQLLSTLQSANIF